MSISVFSYWIDPNGGTTSDSIKADCIFHEDGSVETCLKSGVVSVRGLSSSILLSFIQENNCSSCTTLGEPRYLQEASFRPRQLLAESTPC